MLSCRRGGGGGDSLGSSGASVGSLGGGRTDRQQNTGLSLSSIATRYILINYTILSTKRVSRIEEITCKG